MKYWGSVLSLEGLIILQSMINALENRILRGEKIATSQEVENSYKEDSNIVHYVHMR